MDLLSKTCLHITRLRQQMDNGISDTGQQHADLDVLKTSGTAGNEKRAQAYESVEERISLHKEREGSWVGTRIATASLDGSAMIFMSFSPLVDPAPVRPLAV
uniref:Uncharacterized protein n=1 Tax=Setaria digitata TaxID=48799 RepID=A0A915PSQ0_9BILA